MDLSFLDKLPLNGIKTTIGIVGALLTLGALSTGIIDTQTSVFLLGLIQTWTGVALAHKTDKIKRGV